MIHDHLTLLKNQDWIVEEILVEGIKITNPCHKKTLIAFLHDRSSYTKPKNVWNINFFHPLTGMLRVPLARDLPATISSKEFRIQSHPNIVKNKNI